MPNNDRPITVYGALWCSYCMHVKEFLGERDIPFEWIDVDEYPEAIVEVRKRQNGKEIIPTVVFPDGSALVAPSNRELSKKLGLARATQASNAVRDVVIIGSGPAGYTAALYAARAALEPLVFTGAQYGGQLMLTTEVDNYPGFSDGILGPQLMAEMRRQAQRFGAVMCDQAVTDVDFGSRPFRITADDEVQYANAVIVATGASARWLGIPGEERYRGHGVSSCATCDGFFFRNKNVVVVGGGDSALEEAIFLSRLAAQVTVIHRRDALRGSKTMQQRAFAIENIRFIWDTGVDEVMGDIDAEKQVPHVTGLRTRNLKTGDEKVVATDALFVAIGHDPNTAVFRRQIPLDEHGYALVTDPEGTATGVEGIFVAGDVRDQRYRQAVTAAGDGCKAALDVERWLEEGAACQVSGEETAVSDVHSPGAKAAAAALTA